MSKTKSRPVGQNLEEVLKDYSMLFVESKAHVAEAIQIKVEPQDFEPDRVANDASPQAKKIKKFQPKRGTQLFK